MPTSVKIDVDAAFIRSLGTNADVVADLRRRGQRVQNKARALAPKDTGKLAQSITNETVRDGDHFVARIGTNVEYAIYVHEGHGWIYPRGRFLRWPATNNSGAGRRRYAGGRTAAYVFAKRVRPVAGRPFLRDALPAAR